MPEEPLPGTPAPPDVLTQLHRLGQLLREVRHLDPEDRRRLAAVVDELATAAERASFSPADAAHLSDSLSHLTQALRRPHEPGLLTAAKERLEAAAAHTQAGVPLAVGIARRLLEALANLGI